MSSEERGRSSYLDLLITTLMEHEKNLDALVARMDKIYEELQAIYEKASSNQKENIILKRECKTSDSEPDSIVYMKIKLDKHRDDIIHIIEALKE